MRPSAATAHRDDPFRLPPVPRPPLAIAGSGAAPVTPERSAR
jgi:hypothetical protein